MSPNIIVDESLEYTLIYVDNRENMGKYKRKAYIYTKLEKYKKYEYSINRRI